MATAEPKRELTVLPAGKALPAGPSPLERDLRETVRGDIQFDALSRTLYSTDASLYQITPLGVVAPRDADDVVRTLNAARFSTTYWIPLITDSYDPEPSAPRTRTLRMLASGATPR